MEGEGKKIIKYKEEKTNLCVQFLLCGLQPLGFAVEQLLVLDEPVVLLLLLLASLHLLHHPLQIVRPLLLLVDEVEQQLGQGLALVRHQLHLELHLH